MGDLTWCYDKAGEATLHDLAPGEGPPNGLSLRPPPGTHPHERELAEIPRETAADPVMRGPDRPPIMPINMPPDQTSGVLTEPEKRGPGRPRKIP